MFNKTLRTAALLAGALSLASCATYDGYVYGSSYDGYYDGFYGPYISGYWANDGYFWYRGPDRIYRRDEARHFHRERFNGGVPFHGERGWSRNHPPPGSPNGPRPGRPPGR